jgi:hypothetical protein
MTTLLLIVLSIACIAYLIFYGGAFIAIVIENKEGFMIAVVMALALLVFAALY